MLPPGHLAVSYLLGKLPRAQLRTALLAGVLPDIDFLLLPLPIFNQIHRVVTHNLLFVLLGGGVLAWRCDPSQRYRVGWTAMASGLTHLLIDACLDANPSNGIGVAWLWPLTAQTYAPINLLTPNPDTLGWQHPLQMLTQALQGILWEIPVYLLAISLLIGQWRRASQRTP